MSERQTIEITNRRLNEICSGFIALKERKLPSVNVDLRVAAQYKALTPKLELYNEVRKKIVSEHEIPGEDVSSDVKLKNKLELRKKLDELDAATVEIFVPLKKLTKADLPVAVKSANGEENNMGLAGIMVALAPEFFELPDESELDN